jgi:UDP-N-acetylmuramyl pentapeptide phosphotransferase/UDP-N-acetylglucosamine-1-phosphate transferase
MGDTGSLTSGFIISCLVIQYIEKGGHSAPAISVALLSIPVFDTLRVFVLRVLHGRSPFMPDRNHIHHKLLELGLPVSKAVLVLLTVNAVCLLFALFFSEWGNQRLLLAIIGFITLLGILLEVFTNFNLPDEEVV